MANTHGPRSRGVVLKAGVAALLTWATASAAQAAHYNVLTNANIAADVVSPNDGYCSLAEAVQSINNNQAATGCTDTDSSNPGQITLVQAPGQTYAGTHYNIRNATITFTRSIRIQPTEEGFRAYVDSAGALAFKVNRGVDVIIYGVHVNHTGTGTGRLFWNAGTLSLGSSSVKNGNVTAAAAGIGGGIYNESTGTLSLYDTQVSNNKAKKGGGIYNDGGNIPYLGGTISSNSATIAGGGLYNKYISSTAPGVVNLLATISSNSANSGGGIANVGGWIVMVGSTTITKNTTVAGSTSPDEVCHAGACTGNGAGVLNLDIPAHIGQFDIGTTDRATISGNVATNLGGGIYSTGYMNLGNITMGGSTASAGNKAKSGAAVYFGALSAGSGAYYPHYCEFKDDYGTSSFRYNVATGTPSTSVYGILDSSGVEQTYCLLQGTSGSNNSKPYCNPKAVRPGFVCPQTLP